MPNYNERTGIPYGVIYVHNLNSDLVQDLWFVHGKDLSYEAALEEFKAEVRRGLEDSVEDPDELEEIVDSRCEYFDPQIDEPTIEGQFEGVKYMISWLGGAPMLWVFESPFTGIYVQCSPCVPGAGDLEHPSEFGVLCYDVPKEWRDDQGD